MAENEAKREPHQQDGSFTSIENNGEGDENDNESISRLLENDLQRIDNEADAIMNSIRDEVFTPPARRPTRSIDESWSDLGLSSGDDEIDDDGMGDEILRLGTVVATLRQDLDAQSVNSMTSVVSAATAADEPPRRYRYDKRTLLALVHAEEAEKFIRKHQLYGPGVGGKVKSTPLFVFTVLVWCFLLALMLHVKYSEIDGAGIITSTPRILRVAMNRFF